MAFIDTKYTTDGGLIISVRTDEDLAGLMGTPATGTVDLDIHGLVNGNRSREFGVHVRGAVCFRTVGTAPDTAKKYKFIPVLTQAELGAAAYEDGATITVSGTVWTVSDRTAESLN